MANPYRFGGSYGAYTDLSTGLVKIGQRYYDPGLGRWTQRDPLGAGNPYGHPAADTWAQLTALTSASYRTDQHGDVAVVPTGDGPVVYWRGPDVR